MILIEHFVTVYPGSYVTIFSGFAKPEHRLCMVFFHTQTIIVHVADEKLGLAVTLFGSFAKPQHRLCMVFFHAQTIIVHFADDVLSIVVFLFFAKLVCILIVFIFKIFYTPLIVGQRPCICK